MVKLWTEIAVANHLKDTLAVKDVHTVHGSIEGGEKSIAVGAVRHFRSIDPSIVAYGSEGSIKFEVGGKSFKISFCCSYGKDLNYGRVDHANLFFDIKLRFANTKPDGLDMTWGSYVCPRNGHPLGILVIVEPRLASEISVLTYNTHLFAGSNASIVAPRVVAHDKARADELLQRVLKLSPDIVCLQEVWALEEQDIMINALSGQYAYQYVAPEGTIKPFFPSLPFFAGGFIDLIFAKIRDALANTSGLVVFSKHPFLSEPKFAMYENLSGDDMYAKKGVIVFTANVLVGDGDRIQHLTIGSTHCPTSVPDATARIKTVAAPLVFGEPGVDGMDALLLGDFNIHKENAREAQALKEVMDHHSAKDLFVELNNTDITNTYTDWPANNSLVYVLNKQDGKGKPGGKQSRIDYMYFKQSKKYPMFTPLRIEVIHDWEVPGTTVKEFDCGSPLTVSDHYPVLAHFRVSDNPI